ACLPIGLLSVGCSLTTMNGDDTTKRVSEIATRRGTVVTYYINTGVVGYYGYHVRQQCTIIPGLLAVHTLLETPDHGSSAKVEMVDSAHVHIRAEGYDSLMDQVSTLWFLPCLWSRAG